MRDGWAIRDVFVLTLWPIFFAWPPDGYFVSGFALAAALFGTLYDVDEYRKERRRAKALAEDIPA